MKLNLIKALLPALFFTQITLAEEVVNFYNWADYIGESTIRDFEKEYGIKVNYDEYDSSEIVEAKGSGFTDPSSFAYLGPAFRTSEENYLKDSKG